MSIHDRPDLTQANATLAALIILNKALALGIHVGTDGDELVMLAPARLPYKTRRWFGIWLDNFRAEVITLIQEDVAARTGATS
jgi:hypothetical protein